MSSGNHGNRIATGWIDSIGIPDLAVIHLDFTPRYVRYFNVGRGNEGLWFQPMPEGTALILRSTGAKLKIADDGLGNWLGVTPLRSQDLDEPDKPRGFFLSTNFYFRPGDTVFWIAIE